MKNVDLYALQDPQTAYYHDAYSKQPQDYPGLQAKMTPRPDCGENSYKGCGRLRERKALVTGGDSGIGRAAAIAFAREGADVALAYLPEEEDDAREVKELIEKEGRKAVLLPGDLRDERYCAELASKAQRELGGLNVMALAAGRQKASRSIEDISTEQLKEVFAVNVFSLFWTLKPAIPLLPAGASIITTSSVVASDPPPNLPDYASTKGAINAFSQALAKQLAPKGIRVNIVAPGPVWTPLQICGGQFQENIPEFGRQTPLGRAGQPVELAGIYVFLASSESSFTTGGVFGATGGLVL